MCSFYLSDFFLARDPLLIVDSKDRIAIALVGQLQTEDFQELVRSCHQVLLRERVLLEESNAYKCSGNIVINAGITYGQGMHEPMTLDAKHNGAAATRLLNNPHIQRFSSVASGESVLGSLLWGITAQYLSQRRWLFTHPNSIATVEPSSILYQCNFHVCYESFRTLASCFLLRPST